MKVQQGKCRARIVAVWCCGLRTIARNATEFLTESQAMALGIRSKKLIGAVVTLVWLAIYSLLAMAVGIRVLPHASALAQFAYYAVAGMAWIVPIGLMFPWMSREPKRPASR
jgi:hypothetical protein